MMKLATVRYIEDGSTLWGVWGETFFYPIRNHAYPTLLSFLEDENRPSSLLVEGEEKIPHDQVILKAPYLPRKNIYCVGKNYRDHVKEMGSFTGSGEAPSAPIFFTKNPGTVIGPAEEIDPHTGVTDALDYEGELAVVIGKRGKNIPLDAADTHIFGYAVLNDVSARDLQKRHQQFFKGKSLDTFAPFGPVILVKDRETEGHPFQVKTYVNGEVRQEGSTDQLIFPIPELIRVLSLGMTLEPGDIIATGTPSGVGQGFNPPRYLRPGDLVEVRIDGIGRLVNRVGKG